MHRKTIGFFLLLFFLLNQQIYAHPGNTDSSGGHTCYTNCESYGLKYGEYHYHDDTSPGIDDYTDGYNRGYEYAYSYTSMCEEEYEWWWEGPQEFGNGYEQGITDGHNGGLEVCIEESYSTGYDDGYQDYQLGFGYEDETDDYYYIDAYVDGYSNGWSEAELEDEKTQVSETHEPSITENNTRIKKNQSTETKTNSLSDSKKHELYEKGYDEGYDTAKGSYNFDDGSFYLDEEARNMFAKGYLEGWYDGGGGSPLERYFYLITHKYKWYTISLIGVILLGLVLFFSRKHFKNKPFPWLKLSYGFSITIVVTFLIIMIMLNNKSEPADSKVESNPYQRTSIDHDCDDFETQKDAQLFFEANGGPSNDPHDLDRDNDGIACEWN